MNDNGPDRVGADTVNQRAAGPEAGEVVADAAALLHRQRCFLQRVEDSPHAVGDAPHDEAIEQGYGAVGARAGKDSAGR